MLLKSYQAAKFIAVSGAQQSCALPQESHIAARICCMLLLFILLPLLVAQSSLDSRSYPIFRIQGLKRPVVAFIIDRSKQSLLNIGNIFLGKNTITLGNNLLQFPEAQRI
jgi:hypothetical protein